MKKLLVASTLALMATAANAASFGSVPGAPDPGPSGSASVVFDFEAATPELSGNFSLVTGDLSGQYAAPAGNATRYAVVPKSGVPAPGTALLDITGFAKPIRHISLYWGSIDAYNTLEFLNGDTVVFTLTGGMLPPANGNQVLSDTNRRVKVLFDPGEQTLTAMRFTSTGKAFEFDDIAIGAVPEPQSWALMIVGFGLVGAAARRRARVTSVTA